MSMTEKEAKEILLQIAYDGEYPIGSSEAFSIAIQDLEEIQQYRAIGTIEEFKALKEKNTPKKGIPCTSSNNHEFVECPNCHKDMDLYYDYCQYCGQSVDWGKSKT